MNYTDIKKDLILNKLTKAQYDELLAQGQISDTELYYIIDDNNRFYTKQETTQLIRDSVVNIEPNPIVPDNATLLTSLTIGETDYKLGGFGGGGSNVVANPEGITGEEPALEAVTIDDVNYLVAAGEMTFSETKVEGEKQLRSININGDLWSIERGSIVKTNIELNGTEPALESVQIDDAKFTLKGEEMVFSENPVEGSTILKNISINEENWSTGYSELLLRIEALEAKVAALEGGNNG